MARNSNPRRRRSATLAFERLEPRVVLDAQLGAALAGDLGISSTADVGVSHMAAIADPSDALARFQSADELRKFLVQDANTRYADLFGREAWTWWGAIDVVPTSILNDSVMTRVESSPDYSTTNTQVAGVDEGDLVKTDGRYLYIGRGADVVIVDVQSAADMRVLAQVGGAGALAALYLTDDRLTVISHQYDLYPQPLLADAAMWSRPWGGEAKFQVAVYDVSAPQTPQLVSRLDVEGSYIDSRLIGDTVYLVSSHEFHLPAPETVPGKAGADPNASGNTSAGGGAATDSMLRIMPWPGPNPDGSGWVYETREQYWERIGDQVLDLALPNYVLQDAAGNVQAGLLSAAEATYRPLGGQTDQLISITAFDIGAEPAVVASSSAPLGWSNTVYVSPTNLYVVSTQWSEAESSQLFKFALQAEAGQIPLVATGRVPGRVLNSFSLDEQGDELRIVTQRGWRAGAQSALYVLEQVGQKLDLRGQLDNLAPGEELYSVRFLGDRAFVVTFGPDGGAWIDPLFTIDLSDPAAPQVEGELEIPGFSNYLQLLDGDLLLGLGRNADESNGRQLEPQVSLFDVADFANPTLTDRVSFGDVSSWSEAFFNHHAVSYFPDQQILAVPLDTWYSAALPVLREGEVVAGDSPLPAWLAQLWVFRVDTTAAQPQLRVLGTIQHETSIIRSLRIGTQLFSISSDTIQVHDIFDPGEQLGELYFGPRASEDWFSVDRESQDNPLDVLANDRLGPEAGAWSIAAVEQPEAGTVAISADGRSLRYTPPTGLVSYESFVYTIVGPNGATADGRVNVSITEWAGLQRMTDLALRDLAQRLAVPVENISVWGSEAVEWSDSCLGVATVDRMCLMVITPGFRINLHHDSTTYVYHTDKRETVLLAKTDEDTPVITDPGLTGSDPLVRVRLEATDASGQVVTAIEAGQTLTLNVYVDDLRDSGDGVYAAYTDIFYPARVVSVQDDSLAYDGVYANGKAGDFERVGVVNELGAFAGLDTLGSGERLLASMSFVARRAGTAAFLPTAADVRGHEVLAYGLNDVIPPRRVEWQGVEVQVLGGWRNTEDPQDVDDDGHVTPQDALRCINVINTHGKPHLERAELQFAAGLEAAADRYFLDVDGDDFLTARDVLLIVNRLNGDTPLPLATTTDAGLPARPLASWVDWQALENLLQEERWQEPLQTLQLSPERTLDLIHELLVTVDADRLEDLADGPSPLDTAQWKAALTPVLDAIRQHVSVDQLLDVADQLQTNFADLDLASLLPGLAPQISLTAASEALQDAFFAKLSDPLFLLDLLDG